MTPLVLPPRHTTLTSAVLCRPVPSSELISVGESDLDLLCCGFNSHGTKMGTIVGSGWAQVGRRWVLSHDAAHMCMRVTGFDSLPLPPRMGFVQRFFVLSVSERFFSGCNSHTVPHPARKS